MVRWERNKKGGVKGGEREGGGRGEREREKEKARGERKRERKGRTRASLASLPLFFGDSCFPPDFFIG